MVQPHEYYRLGESTGPYAYNAAAPGARIDLVQLVTISRLALDKSGTTTSIRQFDELPMFNRPMRSTSTFFLSRTPLIWLNVWVVRNLMSPFEGRYENGGHWRRGVPL